MPETGGGVWPIISLNLFDGQQPTTAIWHRRGPNICAESITHMDYVMSANSSPPPPPHRIAILMSPEGRFLQCRDCQLTYTFPDTLKFGVVAKQFDAQSCVTPIRKPAWQTDRRFVVLRYEGKVPALLHAPDASASSSRQPHSRAMLLKPRSTSDTVAGRGGRFPPAAFRGTGHQSPTLVDPLSPLHHQCAARTLSGWSSLHAPPIPLGSSWSGTTSL